MMNLKISVLLAFILHFSCSAAMAANLVQTNAEGKISKKNSARANDRSTSIADICNSDQEAIIEGAPVFDEALVKRLAAKGVIASIDPETKRFNIHKGRVLISCSKPVELSLGNADLRLAPHTIAYLFDNGLGTCAIMNLHDEHWNAFEVRVGEHKLFLPPGREVTLTSWTKLDFDEANLCSGLWFRRVHEFKPLPTVKGYLTQYSLLSAAYVFPTIRKLANSDSREGRKLVKTAGAVFIASGYPRDYRWKIGKKTEATAIRAESADAKNSTKGISESGTLKSASRSATDQNGKETEKTDPKGPQSGSNIASVSSANADQKPAN